MLVDFMILNPFAGAVMGGVIKEMKGCVVSFFESSELVPIWQGDPA